MTEENLYIKRDLENFANLDNIEDDPGSYGKPRRSEILKQSLDLSDNGIEVVTTGGYQGYMLFVFRKAGNIWLLKDAYGSCSGCDGLLASDHAKYYAEGMLRNAYAFKSDNDAVRFLHKKENDGSYGWRDMVNEGISAINNLPGGTCEIHGSDYVYYDSEDEWTCPFCDS